MQVHTCALLMEQYSAQERVAEAETHKVEMEEKSAELQENADAAVTKVMELA